MKREDDFTERRKTLTSLSDAELYKHFWSLTEQVVDPLLALGKNNTTPSIERSVLLRMGISSLEAKTDRDRLHRQRADRKRRRPCGI